MGIKVTGDQGQMHRVGNPLKWEARGGMDSPKDEGNLWFRKGLTIQHKEWEGIFWFCLADPYSPFYSKLSSVTESVEYSYDEEGLQVG